MKTKAPQVGKRYTVTLRNGVAVTRKIIDARQTGLGLWYDVEYKVGEGRAAKSQKVSVRACQLS